MIPGNKKSSYNVRYMHNYRKKWRKFVFNAKRGEP